MEFLLCTLTPEVQCFTFHRKHLIWRTKITKFWQNGNDSKQPYSCSILMKFLPKKARTYVVFCDYFKIFFEAQILNIHDLITILNYLSSKLLLLYCVFVFNLWFLNYKIMLKKKCKTTFNSAFVGNIFIKIKQELTLE